MDYLVFVWIVLHLLSAASAARRRLRSGKRWMLFAGAIFLAALIKFWVLAWVGNPPPLDVSGNLWTIGAAVLAVASGSRFWKSRIPAALTVLPATAGGVIWAVVGPGCTELLRWLVWFPSFGFLGVAVIASNTRKGWPKFRSWTLGLGLCVLALTGPVQSIEWPSDDAGLAAWWSARILAVLLTVSCAFMLDAVWHLAGREDAGTARDTRRWVREVVIGVALAAILLGGWVASQAASAAAEALWRRQLLQEAELAAGGIAPDLVDVLKAQPSDAVRPAYREIKRRLSLITETAGRYRFAYLLTMSAGKIVFLADSEPEDSADLSHPGDAYEDASPELRELFRRPAGITEGPVPDEWGVWITGFAPVPGARFGGQPVILGLDRSAAGWNDDLERLRQGVMAITFLFALLAASAFAVIDLAARSHAGQLAANEQLRLSLQGAKLGSWEIPPGSQDISLDPSWADLVGTPREQTYLPLAKFLDFFHPDDRARMAAAVERLRTGTAGEFEDEFRIKSPSGRWTWLLNRGRMSPGALHSQGAHLTGFVLDISARKEASDLQRLQSAALEAAANSFLICGPDGKIQWANPAFEKLTGYELSEIVGKTPRILKSGEHDREFYRKLWETINQGKPWSGEIINRRKDGSHFVDDTLITPLLDHKGRVTHYIAVKQDITARKAGEAELARRREEAVRLALVAENTTNAVVITNPQGLVEWVNPGFTRITGFTMAEVAGRKPGHLLQGPESDRAAIARIREAVKSGSGFQEVLLNYTKSGEPYWISIECQPLRDPSGKLTGFMAIEQDISARMAAENALQTQRARIQQINQALLELGHGYEENLNRLTSLAGELFGADCALYNRLEAGMLVARGRFQTPPGFPEPDKADGHLCFDVIRNSDRFLYVENLFDSPYLQTDPNVRKYSLHSYVGQGVNVNGVTLGSLCVVFGRHFQLTEDLRHALAIVAQAIGREELLELNRRKLDGLARSEAAQRSRFSTLLQKLEDAVLVEDASRTITFVNQSMERMFGMRAQDLVGHPCQDIARGAAENFSDPDRFISSVEEAIAAGRAAPSAIFTTIDGKHLERDFLPIRDGSILHGYLWKYRDITLQQSSRALLEAIAEVGQLVLSKPLDNSEAWAAIARSFGSRVAADSLFFHRVADPGGFELLADWNAGICNVREPEGGLWGLAKRSGLMALWGAQLASGTSISISRAKIEAPPLAEAGLRSFLCVPLRVRGELWGTLSVVYCRCEHAWRDEESALFETAAELVGSRLDLQRSEWDLIAAKDAADAANRAKSTFLATMSHEIRTPLNAVIGMSSLLLETRLEAQQREYASTITASAETLLDLINDILDYSKIEAGHIEIEKAPFNLSDCLFEPLEMQARAAAEKGVELSCTVDPTLPHTIEGDRTRLKQVLINIVANAIKFTSVGEVRLCAEPAGNDRLRIAVIDSGIGIPESVRPRLFRPFVQADSSVTRKFGGTGLGLAISKRLVELMGGELDFESTPGKGTTFFFSIPLVPAEAALQSAGHSDPARELRGLHVLIVDDNPVNRLYFRDQVRIWGITSRQAESGAEALKILAGGEAFDLILTDYHMPGMDGVTFARAARAMRPQVPIVLLSSVLDAESGEGLFAVKIAKPVRPTSLKSAICSAVSAGGAGARSDSAPAGSEVAPAVEPEAASDSAKADAPPPLRVLLAEDNPTNQRVMQLMFRKCGISAKVANNGLEAVDAVAAGPFDLVFLDVQMPVMDGITAAKEIRSRFPEGARRPYLVALTANAFKEDREACLAAGMDSYLPKPITLERLKSVLANLQPAPSAAS